MLRVLGLHVSKFYYLIFINPYYHYYHQQLLDNSVEDVGRDIAWGSISCVITLLVTSFFVLFVCASISPVSETALSLSPLDEGTTLIYGLTQYPGVLAIPATYATAFGFMFAYGRMLESMAQSGLLPNVLTLVTEKTGAPYIALWAGE